MPMTLDDVTKPVLGLLAALVAWLAKTVLNNRDRITQGEGARRGLEARVNDLVEGQLTTEDVREVVEEAMEKRDKAAFERRQEYDRRLALEIKATVREEVDRITTRLDPGGSKA